MTATATRPRKKATKKKYPTKTPEQREAELKARHDMLVGQVQTLTTSEGWKAYLKMATRFHSYSFGNLMLIMAQNAEATQVAGFRKWQDMGRQVRKGEKSIMIVGFAQRAPRQEEIDSGKCKEGEKVTYFPPRRVFDIAQTDIVDPEKWEKVAGAGTGVALLQGEDANGIGEAVAGFITDFGWDVLEEDLPLGVRGRADPDREAVLTAPGLSPAQRAKTLIHEAAHVVDGHTDDLAEYARHRGRMEAIAESTACVVADALGLDTSDYSVGYVATWTEGDLELLKDTAEAVLRTAKAILAGLAPQDEDQEDDEGE